MKIIKQDLSLLFRKYREKNDFPVVVEVLGTPNSGKTTAIQTFERALKRKEIKSKVIYEAAKKCKIKNKFSPEFNIWTLNETLKQLVEAYFGNYDIIICERGLLDAICWYNIYYQDRLLTEKEYNTLVDFVLLSRFTTHVNLCYVMKCSPEISMERESLPDFVDELGPIVNETVLSKYNATLNHVVELYGNYFKKIVTVETSYESPKSILQKFIDEIVFAIK